MVKVQFPGLKLGRIFLKSGQILDTWLLGIHILVPYTDWEVLGEITFWEPFTLFNTDDIVKVFAEIVMFLPEAIWEFLETWLWQQVDEYEETHKDD